MDEEPTRREVLDCIDDPIIALDASLTVTYADDDATALLHGESPKGAHLDDLIPHTETPPSTTVSRAMATADRTTFSYVAPDGRYVDARVFPSDDGVSLLLSPDAAATPETVQQFRRIVENLPIAVGRSSLGEEGTFSYVNDAMVETFGAETSAEIKNQPVGALYADPDDRRALHATLQETGRVDEREIVFETLEGSTFHGAVTATLEDIAGETYVLKIIQDVTERTKREEELRTKTRAIEEAPFGVIITDPDQPDNPMTYVNQSFVDVTGYTKDDAIGRNCRFLQGEDTDPEAVERLRAAINDREEVTVELRNYRKDGTEFWNRVTIAPVEDDDGTVTNFIGFQEDISEREAYESQMETQRDNLKTLNEVLRHDIRNDLQLILARGELLDEHVDPAGEEHLDDLLESAENAVELTRTARNMADVMLQRSSDLESVSIRRTLDRVIEEVDSANADAVVETAGTIPAVTVQANDMLDSVFRNLLSNAIQHNDTDAPRVHVSAAVDDDVVVSVADNGPGVPDGQKEDIFGKGERGLDSDGTGLGLYLVRSLVDIYGGDVWVEDNEPEGALFKVRLPTA
jgi:PAS domain S-box-containing protein